MYDSLNRPVFHCSAMGNWEAFGWLLGVVLAIGIVGAGWNAYLAARKRHARRLRYERMGRRTGPQRPHSAPAPLTGSIHPGKVAAIRAHAERTARRDWVANAAPAANPYASGTPEFVLWYASYQLTRQELVDEPATEQPPAPSDPRISRQ
jgi:hypothetical protein